MSSTPPFDAPARAAALDISRSFIVQAPAGSGKTELLTQRFLKLLGHVDRPERLLAITFTRKATQEMRERILRRLRQAASAAPPDSDHERLAIDLAQKALHRDQKFGWNILQNPGRLRVLTIDGLCAQYLARDPKLGGLGAGLAVQELAEPLYREAIEDMFKELASISEQGDDWSEARRALGRVLYLLDGDAQQLRKLLVDKLQARDQWVDRIGMSADTLATVIAERQELELKHFYEALDWNRYKKACALTAELGAAVTENYPPSNFAKVYQPVFEGLQQQVHQAYLFCKVVLKADNNLRSPKYLNRGVFKDLPQSMDEGLKLLQGQLAEWAESSEASAALERMGKAPPLELGEDTTELQQDITLVLAHALARLRVLFHDRGECDFHYMTELALESLGEEDEPGSLLLAEDARIEHILMDEFQDTSNTQFRLLRRLISGWTSEVAGEGQRSLFLVGDPMQSIYRFRQANVGLFIDVVQQGGLGAVELGYLQLRSNFRSKTEIVDWVNQQFTGIFPARDDRDSGAVRYASAAAEKGAGGAVQCHAFPPKTPDEVEAQRVVELVEQARAEFGDPTIGILARARKHIEQIARALQQAGIEAQAVKIDALKERPVVLDLMALTRALSHPCDRIAWLAVLRAPWSGLSVAELHEVCGSLHSRDLLACIQEAASSIVDGNLRMRLQRIATVMTQAEQQRANSSLRDRIEFAWIKLGGPLCYASGAELDHARTFFDLLQKLEEEGTENIETRLQQSLEDLYAGSSNSRLQLMTIHQAKGLEFDVVILPGMARKPRGDDKTLVAMQQFHKEDGEDSSLLAPLPARIKPDASLYEYLRTVEVERSAFEQQRLLYVACTRAKQQLHLLGKYSISKEKGVYATKGSLMELLFSAFSKAIGELPDDAEAAEAVEDDNQEVTDPKSYPLLQLQEAPLLPLPDSTPEEAEAINMPELPVRQSVAFGDVVHQWLELIHDHWSQGWDASWFESHPDSLESSLRRAGFNESEAAEHLPQLVQVLTQATQHEPGRAAVSPEDKQASWSELPLLRRDGNRISKHIIDRLYRDESGELVIVDYKTGEDTQTSRGLWLDQLNRYKGLLRNASEENSEALILQISPTQLNKIDPNKPVNT